MQSFKTRWSHIWSVVHNFNKYVLCFWWLDVVGSLTFYLGSWISMVFHQMEEVVEDATPAGADLARVEIFEMEVEIISLSRLNIFQLWQFSTETSSVRKLYKYFFIIWTNKVYSTDKYVWSPVVQLCSQVPQPTLLQVSWRICPLPPGTGCCSQKRQGPGNCKLGQNQVRGFLVKLETDFCEVSWKFGQNWFKLDMMVICQLFAIKEPSLWTKKDKNMKRWKGRCSG